MEGFLNSGFGEVLGNTWLERIASLGFAGIRTDIEPNTWEVVVDELGKFEILAPIFLFGGGYMKGWTAEGFFDLTAEVAKKIRKDRYFQGVPVYFEIGNEPDIAVIDWRQDPRFLADTYWECYRYVKAIHGSIELITGGVSNLNERGLDWLEDYMSYSVQNKAIVGFHRYPNGSSNETPHDGFPTREHEMSRLQALAGGRRLFCTETGISTGPYKQARDFPLCFLNKNIYLTDEKQAKAFKIEWNFYRRRGIIGMVWYQKGDGPKRTRRLDNYGVFNYAEEEKVACKTIREVLLTSQV